MHLPNSRAHALRSPKHVPPPPAGALCRDRLHGPRPHHPARKRGGLQPGPNQVDDIHLRHGGRRLLLRAGRRSGHDGHQRRRQLRHGGEDDRRGPADSGRSVWILLRDCRGVPLEVPPSQRQRCRVQGEGRRVYRGLEEAVVHAVRG